MIKVKTKLILVVVGLMLPSISFATSFYAKKESLGSSNGLYQYLYTTQGHVALPFIVQDSATLQGTFANYHTSNQRDFCAICAVRIECITLVKE